MPYTLSTRAPAASRRGSARHPLRPDSGARPAAIVGARRRAAHRPLAAPGAGRARDELPDAAEPAADARERVRLLVRALSRSCARPRCARSSPIVRRAIARGRDRAHRLRVRRRRDRGDLRARPARRRPARRDPARRPRARRRQRTCPPDVAAAVGDAPFVLAIGTLEPRKNLPHLVGAFGELAAPRARRCVSSSPATTARRARGRRRDRAAAGRRARRASCSPGAVSDAGRRALLERATVLAYPSIYEGFGFPVLEAMTAGVPVVAARRRFDSRGRGRRRAARRADRRTGAGRRDRTRPHRRRRRARSSSPAAATGCRRSRGTTPRGRSRRATGDRWI